MTSSVAVDVPSNNPAYVQFGCGLTAPASWVNFDASPTLLLQRTPLIGVFVKAGGPRFPANARYGDIVRGLPIQRDSCVAIYCSHVLEHLSLSDLRVALSNARHCLRPGGVFRLVVPDLEFLAQRYLASKAEQPSSMFMKEAHLGYCERPRGLGGLLRDWIGASRHLWMWDYKSLAYELKAAGFVNIRRAVYGDSDDLKFCEVEDRGRWQDCLGIECFRPAD